MSETPTEKWIREVHEEFAKLAEIERHQAALRAVMAEAKPEVTFTPTPEKESMVFVGGCTCDGPDPCYGAHREWCGYEPARWKKNSPEVTS